MASDPANITTSSIKLKGPDNYDAWMIDIGVTLRVLGLAEHIVEGTQKPTAPEALQKWNKDNDKVVQLLMITIHEAWKPQVTRAGWKITDTALQTFQAINRSALQMPNNQISDIMPDFWGLKAHNFANLDAYLTQLNWHWRQIKSVYPETNDEQYVWAALRGIKESCLE
ncbi:hypothetical protein CDD82_2586 [Ophiocordyceps australis]|uniref:Retrotransposon Copia-like N-terminal domain-containing protein n=1 Tax=Ophiocordyceps australis TaxID=1399860 RepID=A0A2C5XRB7_9HYPO|nr:hypothetical protein CDD82_2586 [Ophiocordyceps australis]